MSFDFKTWDISSVKTNLFSFPSQNEFQGSSEQPSCSPTSTKPPLCIKLPWNYIIKPINHPNPNKLKLPTIHKQTLSTYERNHNLIDFSHVVSSNIPLEAIESDIPLYSFSLYEINLLCLFDQIKDVKYPQKVSNHDIEFLKQNRATSVYNLSLLILLVALSNTLLKPKDRTKNPVYLTHITKMLNSFDIYLKKHQLTYTQQYYFSLTLKLYDTFMSSPFLN
ncbi:hypothetical protein K502DRAFT_349562 [Neoconidiobolus thromboides FSU 785]|nr:hypothetical protein K502DRAFT_349562 [Neoconidiobolus thromboides FSU 785]